MKTLNHRMFTYVCSHLLLLGFTCFSALYLNGQCPDGELRPASQEELDDFKINYPNCTEFPNDIWIDGDDITDLSPLSNLQSIGGSLTIHESDLLQNLNDLSNLQTIVGDLNFSYNNLLQNIDGLSSLQSIGGGLDFRENNALENINGFINLTTINGDLVIQGNSVLENINGLSNIQSIDGRLFIFNVDNIENLDGFSSLQFIGDDLSIQTCDKLQNIDGLSNLSSITNDILVFQNPILENLNGFSGLLSVGTSVYIGRNFQLTDFQGLCPLFSNGFDESEFTQINNGATFDPSTDCPSCEITGIELGSQSNCAPLTNTYTQALEITYQTAPSSGQLNVNGQLFDIASSLQTVVLTDLISNGEEVDVTAFFTDQTDCRFESLAAFTAPVSCEGVDPSAIITAYVWDDRNGNGIQNSSESGSEGVEVSLILQAGGSEIDRQTTDSDGKVIFDDLSAYNDERVRLKFIEKTGQRLTLKDKGGDDKKDSDADRNSGLTGAFTLIPDTEITKWDAGMWSLGTVEAYVWDDQNGNGIQNSSEPPLVNVQVDLLESNNSVLSTTTTGNDGIARFSNVPADRALKLRFYELDDYRFTLKDKGGDDNKDSDADRNSGRTGTFQASMGDQTHTKMDAGLWSSGQVEAYVWDDRNGNGIQNSSEPPLANVQVDLLESNNSVLATAATGSDGIARFTNVPADWTLKLRFYEPENYRFTLKDKGGDDNKDSDADRNSGRTGTFQASQGNQTHTKMDAGFWSLGTIEAYVWNDENGNGVQNSSESGQEGVQVDLLKSNNAVISTTTTGVNGLAIFNDVPADQALKLRFYTPDGFIFTLKDKGSDDKKDSDADRNSGRTGTFQASMGDQSHTNMDAGIIAEGNNRMMRPEEGSSISDEIYIKLYPNPFQNTLSIEWEGSAQHVIISLINLMGQELYLQQLTLENRHEISIGDIPQGMYILRIIGKEFKQDIKVMKE